MYIWEGQDMTHQGMHNAITRRLVPYLKNSIGSPYAVVYTSVGTRAGSQPKVTQSHTGWQTAITSDKLSGVK